MKKKNIKGEAKQLKKIVLPHLETDQKLQEYLAKVILKNYTSYIEYNETSSKNEKRYTDFKNHYFQILYIPKFEDLVLSAGDIIKAYLPNEEAKSITIQTTKYPDEYNKLLQYINRIKQTVKYAFQMQKMEQLLEDIIVNIDQPTEEYKTKIPRYRKLQRLKQINNEVVVFFLSTLHNFYWFDLAANITTNENINDIIKRITPITINLHKALLDELHYEFPKDLNEEAIYY